MTEFKRKEKSSNMLKEALLLAFRILAILLFAGLPFVLLHLLLGRKKKKGPLTSEEVLFYWRYPRLAFQLSRSERRKVTKKFLELEGKSREKNRQRTIKIWKEKNAQLPHVVKEIGEK